MAMTGDQGPSDNELIEAVRHGSTEAYGGLYQRHVSAAYTMARQLTNSPADADELVSDAFAKIFDLLRGGRGPTIAFRAYLLTSLRNAASDRARRDGKTRLADDVSKVSGADTSVPFTDTAVADLERSLAARAFARLPERWQTVLWHIEIERQRPAEVAPLLGLTANGVSALAYRAREGLRQAYLQVHLAQLDDSQDIGACRACTSRLGAWTRRGLSKRETAQVETHLDNCVRCRALAAELVEANDGMRAIVGAMVLGGVGATGYLSAGHAAAGTAGANATPVPRQAVFAGVSAVALVAAIAMAMTAGNQLPQPPAAEHPSPPSPPSPAPRQAPPAPQSPETLLGPRSSQHPTTPDPPIPSSPTPTPTPTPAPIKAPQQPPHPVDSIHIEVSVWESAPWLSSRVRLSVRDTGTSNGLAEATVRLPDGMTAVAVPPECELLPNNHRELRCTHSVAPSDSFGDDIWLAAIPAAQNQQNSPVVRTVPVPVTATLRSATDTNRVDVRWLLSPRPPNPGGPAGNLLTPG
jgi:RNA polymerase sigma factor (sigma-70 family)